MSKGERTTPSDLLSLVGESRRVAILEALVEHRRENPRSPALSFSDLHDASGIADKGNFNYHLDRLLGEFVEKSDEGYELTAAGSKIGGIVISGAYSDRATRTVPGETCRIDDCGANVVVQLQPGRTRVECADGHLHFEISVPPGAAETRSPSELLSLASFYWQQVAELHARGTCFECFGPEVGEVDLVEPPDGGDPVPRYRSVCDNCGLSFHTPPGVAAVRHPAMISLFYDAGVDVRELPPWEIPMGCPETIESVSEDPLRVRFVAEAGEGAVHFEVDRGGEVTVVEEEH